MPARETKPFVVDVETAWDPPSVRAVRWRYLRAAIDLVMALDGSNTVSMDTPTGEPRWRVTLSEGGVRLAASPWSREWRDVERVRGDWDERVASMTPAEIRSKAHRW